MNTLQNKLLNKLMNTLQNKLLNKLPNILLNKLLNTNRLLNNEIT